MFLLKIDHIFECFASFNCQQNYDDEYGKSDKPATKAPFKFFGWVSSSSILHLLCWSIYDYKLYKKNIKKKIVI